MKTFISLYLITIIKYISCDDFVLSQENRCKILIETVYQESCTILMRSNSMGKVMMALQNGNDSKAIEFCRLVPEGAECVLTSLPTQISDDCKHFEEYNSKLAVAQYDKSYSNYFCANDIKNLRDRSELDGMDCLYVSAFYQCKHRTHKTNRIKYTKQEELCRDIYLDIKCSEHWGPCQNQKVRDIQLRLFEVMQNGMGCPLEQ